MPAPVALSKGAKQMASDWLTQKNAMLINRLREPSNWLRQERGKAWKDAVNTYDRAPFDAANALETLNEELRITHEAVACLASAVKSGEQWTDTLQNMTQAVLHPPENPDGK